MLNPLIRLAERLRADGFEVSASELIDATRAMACIDLGVREELREALRVTMVKEPDPLAAFDRAFEIGRAHV